MAEEKVSHEPKMFRAHTIIHLKKILDSKIASHSSIIF